MRDIVSCEALAELLGVSRAELFRLVDLGVVVREGRGRYPAKQNIQRYCQYLRNRPDAGGHWFGQKFDPATLP